MISVSVCHACDVAVFGCLVAMYFIPRERCLVEGGRVHTTPWVVSLIMPYSPCFWTGGLGNVAAISSIFLDRLCWPYCN